MPSARLMMGASIKQQSGCSACRGDSDRVPRSLTHPRPPPRQPTYHGLAEVGAEAALIQRGRHHLAKGGGLDVPLLAQPVQIVLEGKALRAAEGHVGAGRARGGVGARARQGTALASCARIAALASHPSTTQAGASAPGTSVRPAGSQRLRICSEPRQADEKLVVDLVDLLVVSGQRLQLHAKPKVATNRHALLARHGHWEEGRPGTARG